MCIETEFNSWIRKINVAEKPKSEIIAYNFGLLERENGFAMYIIGSMEYDAEDDDWACNTDFEPKNKYLDLPMEYAEGKGWEDILIASTELIKNYLKSNDFQTSIFKNAKAITTGFDDGDLVRIK
jgi:hypothetical protein